MLIITNNNSSLSFDDSALDNPFLEDLEITSCPLDNPPPMIDITASLITLTLQSNELSDFEDSYFEDCIFLEELVIAHNFLTAIPNLSGASWSLKTLKLYSNRITDVFNLYHVPFHSLRDVDLSDNNIIAFCFQPRFVWPVLGVIHLDETNLSHVYVPHDYGVALYLAETPIHCDFQMSWLRRCHDGNKGSGVGTLLVCGNGTFIVNIRCASPLQVAGLNPLDAGQYLPITELDSYLLRSDCGNSSAVQT